jgi:hypothetical protein
VNRVRRFVHEPENQSRQGDDEKQRQYGKKPYLFLVRRWIFFTPLIAPAEHGLTLV